MIKFQAAWTLATSSSCGSVVHQLSSRDLCRGESWITSRVEGYALKKIQLVPTLPAEIEGYYPPSVSPWIAHVVGTTGNHVIQKYT